MFGLISKKRIARIALEIYMKNDTGKSCFEKGDARVKDFYYHSGNANALNALCHKIGINLTELCHSCANADPSEREHRAVQRLRAL